MTQKLSPAAAREIWAVLAREAKPTQGEKFTDLKDHLFYLLNDLQCRIDEDPEAKPLGWWLDRDVEFNRHMVISADSDGVSIGVAVPKGSLHEVEAKKETIN